MSKLILNFKSKDSKKIKNPKNFLGGKGANLSEMGRMGLPVPPGFTISTKVCEMFYKDKKKLNLKLIYSLFVFNKLKFIKFWKVLHNILISSNLFFLNVSLSSFTFTLSKNSKISFLALAKIDNDSS